MAKCEAVHVSETPQCSTSCENQQDYNNRSVHRHTVSPRSGGPGWAGLGQPARSPSSAEQGPCGSTAETQLAGTGIGFRCANNRVHVLSDFPGGSPHFFVIALLSVVVCLSFSDRVRPDQSSRTTRSPSCRKSLRQRTHLYLTGFLAFSDLPPRFRRAQAVFAPGCVRNGRLTMALRGQRRFSIEGAKLMMTVEWPSGGVNIIQTF